MRRVSPKPLAASRVSKWTSAAISTRASRCNIIAGTVGGGTQLPTPKAGLELIAQGGPLNAAALAEIIAGVALAGELSLSAAICADEFAAAHLRFARGALA